MTEFFIKDKDGEMIALGEFVRRVISLARASELTMADLADLVQVTRMTLNRWASGKFYPAPAQVDKLLEVEEYIKATRKS